jgi:hypothetical protein
MRWLGVSTKVFSVGNYRREQLGSLSEEWFDPSMLQVCFALFIKADLIICVFFIKKK